MTLAEELERLRRWLVTTAGAPPMEDARVVELTGAEIGASDLALSHDRLMATPDFEKRWAVLLAQGYAWINLSCYGLHGRTLIAAIELPRAPRGAPRTSVNLSGPPTDPKTGRPSWDAALRIRVVGMVG